MPPSPVAGTGAPALTEDAPLSEAPGLSAADAASLGSVGGGAGVFAGDSCRET